ncbi:MAG: VWA domain-containing protein [Maricaulaceae bacterium]|nr:VWA domain-containing protein [Maricaulaceae bacterium]
MRRILGFLKRFAAGRAGNTAIIFALALLPIALGVGAAIDFAQAQNARTRLAAAVDAAALAVGGSPNLSDGAARQLAEDFLNSNYTEGQIGRVRNLAVSIDDQSGVVVVSAESAVRTSLLALMGMDEIVVSWEAEVRRGRQGIELVMVLDTSGSMNQPAGGGVTRIQALRDSVSLLVNTLFDNADDPDRLSIGLAPYSTAVNVGTQHARAWWLDPNAQNPIHREHFTFPANHPQANRWTLFDTLGAANPQHRWAGCVEARRMPYDIDDTPPDPGQPDTLFVPYFAPDEGDGVETCQEVCTGAGRNRTCTEQCVTQRRFPNSYRRDIPPGQADWDLLTLQGFIPKYLGVGLPDNAAPYWSDFPSGPNWLCVSPPITAMTSSRNALLQAANGLYAHGGTNIPLGIGWGTRLLSPMEPFPSPVPYNDQDTFKAMVIMTDGVNQWLGGSSFGGVMGANITALNHSIYSAYGYSRTGRIGTTSSNSNTLRNALDDRTRAACQVAQDRGIRVYTIVFSNDVDGATQQLMRDCASHPSLYFYSPTPAALQEAFNAIAGDLSNLRLAR